MVKVKSSPAQKNKLSVVLRNWLPILQANLNELDSTIEKFRDSNPLIDIHSGFDTKVDGVYRDFHKLSRSGQKSDLSFNEYIESSVYSENSIYEHLIEQITYPLFPTPLSEKIAYKIIDNLDESGYFDGSLDEIAKELKVKPSKVEEIRIRFSLLEPSGIGANDLQESFIFQLRAMDNIDDELYQLIKKMIYNLKDLHKMKRHKLFQKGKNILEKFKNPPAVEFIDESPPVVPDLFILHKEHGFEIYTNDSYYPKIDVNHDFDDLNSDFVSQKLREAKLLIDALHMRKATLYKVGLMILEYQYEFFNGGALKPLTLQVLADEFGHNVSTISRAISNKYIQCDRGLFPMKDFFSNAIDVEISSDLIRDTLIEVIEGENRKQPLSDIKILAIIKDKFKDQIESGELKLGRRTIAKYRYQLNIESSSKRRRIYMLDGK